MAVVKELRHTRRTGSPAADVRGLVEAIARRSGDFTPAQERVAQLVLRDPSQVAFMNAKQLGEAADVSEASIVRFACSIGFAGYREMRASTQRVVSHQLTLTRRYLDRTRPGGDIVHAVVQANINNIQTLAASLSAADVERAAKKIAQARRCYVVGFRAAAGLALVASSAISQLCHNCVQLSFESGETIDLLVGAGPRDVLLAIGFRRYSHRTLQIARFLHQRGAFVIAVTDSVLSPLKDSARIMLAAEVESPIFPYSLVAPHCVIDSLVLALSHHMGTAAAGLLKDWEDTYRRFGLLEGM